MWTRMAVMAGALVCVAAATVGGLRAWPERPPTLDCPVALDCEEVEAGQVSVVRFGVRNIGDRPLHLTDLWSGCGCAGLEYDGPDGQFTQPAELVIAPRSVVQLAARVAVSLPTDQPFSRSIGFRTNDPARPDHRLVLTVPPTRTGFRAEPRVVLFGAVSVGGTAEQVVEVTDAAAPPRRIDRLTVRPGAPFAVRLLPADAGRPDRTRVAITFAPNAAGPSDDQVELWPERPAGLQPIRVSVSGRGVPAVELLPASVFLPLASDDGPVYSTDLLCQVAERSPTNIAVGDLPAGLSVTTVGPIGPVTRLRVRYDRSAITAESRLTVPVVVTAGDQAHRMELSVHISPPG